jgi:hypothetical protein
MDMNHFVEIFNCDKAMERSNQWKPNCFRFPFISRKMLKSLRKNYLFIIIYSRPKNCLMNCLNRSEGCKRDVCCTCSCLPCESCCVLWDMVDRRLT